MGKRKICFVAPNAYPLLRNESDFQFMGGAELQQVLLGRCLQKEGYEVSFVTLVWGGRSADECLGGMRTFKAYARDDGVRYLRFFYPRMVKTWRALEAAGADVYYQRGAASLTAIVALYCKVNKKIFIFSGAHDSNFMMPSKDLQRVFDKKLYRWGLERASCVFVQSNKQKELLFKNYRIRGSVFNNVYPERKINKNDCAYILWVGNIKKIKRPLLFLEVAKRLPGYRFIMIGGCAEGHEELYKRVDMESKNLINVEFLGFRPLDETERYFDGASVLICTSEMEGFPNTFLQAWSRGIPAISFLDIDNVISSNKLGIVVETVEEVEENIQKIVNLPIEKREAIRNYFIREHAVEMYAEKLNEIIDGKDMKVEVV